MEYPGFVIAAWAAAAVGLGGYAFAIVRRGKRLSEQLPEDKRRWSDS